MLLRPSVTFRMGGRRTAPWSWSGRTGIGDKDPDGLYGNSDPYNENYDYSFQYDLAGNPKVFKGGGSLTFNPADQFTTPGFGYDHNGNPIDYSGSAFTFDPESQLTTIPGGFQAIYNGDGLRAIKTAPATTYNGTRQPGYTNYFLYDGDEPVVEEINTTDTTGADPGGNKLNVYGPDGLRQSSDPATRAPIYYFYDPQGSLAERIGNDRTPDGSETTVDGTDVAVFDAFGALHGEYDADEYEGYSVPVAPPDSVGFGGQYGYYTDTETGLVMMTHRYYDAGKGRFINRDPIGAAGGINLYGFVGNNPVTGSDPMGLFDVTVGGFEFDNEDVSEGLKTGLAATGSSLTFGLYGGGRFRNKAGFGGSRAIAGIGREALITAGTLGVGDAISAARAARAAAAIKDTEEGAEGATAVARAVKCFTAGTMVESEHGQKPIAAISVQDEVLSRNSASRPAANQDIASGSRLETELDLDLSQGNDTFDETLVVSASTTVALENGAAGPARDLRPGDQIFMTGNRLARVKRLKTRSSAPRPLRAADSRGDLLCRVIGRTRRVADRVLYLYTSDELIKTTPEHPFAVKGKGWVAAGLLKPGDQLESESGRLVTVGRTEVQSGRQMVYNLLVEGAHDYFVGKDHLLVHNGGDCVPTLQWGGAAWKTVRESSAAERQAGKLAPKFAKVYQSVIDKLASGNLRGLNAHELRGGKWAADITGMGGGRGGGRVIYRMDEDGVIDVIEIITGHRY